LNVPKEASKSTDPESQEWLLVQWGENLSSTPQRSTSKRCCEAQYPDLPRRLSGQGPRAQETLYSVRALVANYGPRLVRRQPATFGKST
jgi:hypothetical protein